MSAAHRLTLLVTAAGGGASNNLIRSLRRVRPRARIVGCNVDPWYLTLAPTDARYLVPRADAGAAYVEAIRRIVAEEAVDVVIAGNDAEVGPLAAARADLGARTLLPAAEAVALAQDKLLLARRLAERDVPVARTVPIEDPDAVADAFAALGSPARAWCRPRRGSASKGALPVTDPEQAAAWIRYWRDMRGVDPRSFQLCEYLPGRDFALQSLWHEGELVLARTCERLEYLMGEWFPSGQSSTPRVARLVDDPRVNEVGLGAVRAVDPRASGIFAVDLKEDEGGTPCVTEINIGRFFMISPVFHETGRHHMADLYVRLALGEAVSVPAEERLADLEDEETFLVRELDTLPAIRTRTEVEEGYRTLATFGVGKDRPGPAPDPSPCPRVAPPSGR